MWRVVKITQSHIEPTVIKNQIRGIGVSFLISVLQGKELTRVRDGSCFHYERDTFNSAMKLGDFEGRLRRIYERARTVQEIEAELVRLREQMDDERQRFEQTWARTAGIIETRFDQRVKQVFRKLKADLPEGLARFDAELDGLITGFLQAKDISHRRVSEDGRIRYEMSASCHLPDGWREGGAATIGHANRLEDADPLHLGHPLVQAAVDEAREATQKRFCVTWVLNDDAPQLLKHYSGKRGYLVLMRVHSWRARLIWPYSSRGGSQVISASELV